MCAKLCVASFSLQGEDNPETVTTDFVVGNPTGIVWTPSTTAINIAGNNASIVASCFDNVTLTATVGEFSKVINLKLNHTSGVNDINSSKTIVTETFYNVAGVKVERPEYKTGNIYVIVRSFNDGSSEVVKEQF